MKRPLALIGLVGLSAQCIALLMNPALSLPFGLLFLIFGVLLCAVRRFRVSINLRIGVLTAAVVIIATAVLQFVFVEPMRDLDGMQAAISGTVESVEQTETYTAVTIQADSVLEGSAERLPYAKARLILYTNGSVQIKPYMHVKIESVSLYAPQEGFGLSARSSYAARRVYLLGSFSGYDCITSAGERPWYALFSDVRADMNYALCALLPERLSSVVRAMLLGERQAISTEVSEDFRRSGLSAMLVVSGLHLSILVGGLLKLLHKLLRSYRGAAVCCIPAVFFFMILNGFSGSITRAGISMLIYLLAIVLVRNADPLNSLGAAAMILLFTRPFIGGDAGVQLSFLATAGILTISAPMFQFIWVRMPQKLQQFTWLKGLFGAGAVSVAAAVYTMPLIVLLFGELPLLGPAANILFAIPAQVLLLSGALTAVFGAMGLWVLARPIGVLIGLTANLFLDGTHLLAQGPILYNMYGTLVLWIAVVMSTVGVLLLVGAGRRKTVGAVCACILLLLIPVFAGTGTVPQPTVYVLQCGNGLAVQVTDHDRSITLLQGGNSNMTTEIRRHFAPRFAGTVIVADPEYSPHTAQAAAYLVEYQKADAVVLAADYLPDEIRAAQPNCPIQTGMSAPVYGGENLCAELIQTDCGNWFYITVCGQRILIPLSENDAAELPPGRRSSEILVLAHPVAHIENLRAKNIVLSCSAYQTADLLVMAGALGGNFYSVAQNGNLQMKFDTYGRIAIART